MSVRATDALLEFARRWFDERTVANVFEPLLADHQREWLDAAPAARLRVAMRTATAFIIALLTLTPRALFLTPTPAPITRRVIARMILFMSVVCGLMMLPFFRDLSGMPAGELWLVVLFLLPSLVLVAFPFSMGFTVDGIRRHSTPTPHERIALVRTALVAVVFTTVLHGWVVPETNQQLRLTVWGARQPPPLRGVRELTTVQLIQSPWMAQAERQGVRERAIQRELHTRASFALLPAILMWMRWRALQRPSPQWLLPAWLAATASIVVFFGVGFSAPFLERRWDLMPGAGAWMPLVLFVSIGLMRDRVVRRTAGAA